MANVRWHVNKVEQMMTPVAALLEMAAEYITGAVRKRIARYGTRSGRIYKARWRKGKHQASRAGEPPAVATGTLLQKIGHSNAYTNAPNIWGVDVGDNARANGFNYPAHLEKEMDRPAWVVSLEDPTVQKKIMRLFADKALRRNVGA